MLKKLEIARRLGQVIEEARDHGLSIIVQRQENEGDDVCVVVVGALAESCKPKCHCARYFVDMGAKVQATRPQ